MVRIIQQQVIPLYFWPEDPALACEQAARVCYQSCGRPEQRYDFLKSLIHRGHESVIEHAGASFRIITDRGISHELVRHRLASFSQESTRYCNYSRERFNREIAVIPPHNLEESSPAYAIWLSSVEAAEQSYFRLLEQGLPAQLARSVLPHSLKTELVMTANLREWRHILRLRLAKTAHPQIAEIARNILEYLRQWVPWAVDDIILEH